jgi:preprotein translocase subunit YajC
LPFWLEWLRPITGKDIMHRILATLALASISLAASTAASAQTAAATVAITPGMAVVDTNGGSVGTVISVKGDTLVINTGTHEAAVGASSVTPYKGKLLIGMTKAQLDAATEQTLAQAAAQVVPGATVKGTGGAVIGTIESLDTDMATIKLTTGESIRIPRSGMAGSADGVMVGISLDQLKAQLGATAS